ncbi:hypothetical protein [Archangium lansingense]|uniref:Uncharacterized protein n=1 Tax=Archangium lansingense TaxID=2995310 RepID=A0ABT4AE16_9BACT|nr:hypothetical protein [Archangium lansinium]MCY1079811.1 hypothetical protein [Archangium lansinium]
MKSRELVRLVFEGGWNAGDEVDTPMRGYRSHVWAELADGSRHRMTFYDVTRLAQTLEDDSQAGRPFFAEPGLVILTEVTLPNMEAAARTLAAEGFFEEQH